MTVDEMVGWHHRLNGREFEQALGDSGYKDLPVQTRSCFTSHSWIVLAPVCNCVCMYLSTLKFF